MRCSKRSVFLWVAVLAIGLLGPKLPAAHAQPESLADWPSKDYAPPLKRARVTFSGLGPALRTGDFDSPDDGQLFADYFEKWIFPPITDPLKYERGSRDDAITQLHGMFKQLDRLRGTPVFEKLTDVTLEYMSKIALDGKWHPTIRINAMLAIGEVKSPKAVTLLLGMIRNGKLHPTFRVVAMADMVHLAEQGVLADPAVADPVIALMLKAVGAKASAAEWRWMRGQAADVLGAIGSPGRGGEVFAALLVAVGDEELPLTQRGKAARALGKLKYENGVPDIAALVKKLAAYGSDALGANLPLDARRVRAVARDVMDGLEPLKAENLPKVSQLHDAMDKFQKEALKQQPNPDKPPVNEDEFKQAIVDAKSALDAAAGKRSK